MIKGSGIFTKAPEPFVFEYLLNHLSFELKCFLNFNLHSL